MRTEFPLIVPIILAAGASSRMGKSKQLLKIDGEPLLLRTVKTTITANLETPVVVLGANETAHRSILQDQSIDIVTNSDWNSGMASSIRSGIQFTIARNPQTRAVVILVCDQPHLNPDHIKKLIAAFERTKNTIVASAYKETLGVPALFAKDLFQELISLEGQQGAKKIIQQHKDQVTTVPFPHGEIDLDTMEDYNTFIQ